MRNSFCIQFELNKLRILASTYFSTFVNICEPAVLLRNLRFSIELGLLIDSGRGSSLLVVNTGLIRAFFISWASGYNFFFGSLLTISFGVSLIKRF